MGCDIHLYVEKKRVDGIWITADEWGDIWSEECGDDIDTVCDNPYYEGRDYSLFAALAGVRNSYGVNPVSSPRGLPDDACYEVKREAATWSTDAHSHSWLTVKELLSYHMKKKTKYGLDGQFWETTMPELVWLGEPEDVRIVFWFDN